MRATHRLPVGLFAAACWGAALAACGEVPMGQPPLQASDPDLCPAYCALALVGCLDPVRLFDSPEACRATCAAIPQRGAVGDVGGDSVGCRLTYLMAEGRPNIALCTYAQPTGSPACH